MKKYLIAALAAVAGLWGVFTWGLYQRLTLSQKTAQTAISQAEAAESALKRERAAWATRERRLKAAAAQHKKATDELRQVETAAPEWAATPLPEPVRDWLRGDDQSTPEAPSGASGGLPDPAVPGVPDQHGPPVGDPRPAPDALAVQRGQGWASRISWR